MFSVPAPTHSVHDHDGGDGGHNAIRGVVAKHGPAMGHQLHSNGDGTHNVTSYHATGHVHSSQNHPDFGHAHEHIGIAHGMEG